MRVYTILPLLVLIFIFTADFCIAEAQEQEHPKSNKFQKTALFIDFTDYQEGSIESWLKAKGFEFKLGANSRRAREFHVDEKGLTVEVKRRIRGYLLNEAVDLEKYSKVLVEWGVIKYPEGASFEKSINNEVAMLVIFFGYEKISSGHFAIPDSPYFIGFFLGKNDKVNKAYKGRYFHKGGRFVCVGNPQPYETIITEINLIEAFQTYFGKNETPVISGIALGGDTSSSKNFGRAAAFIKRIEFFE